MTDKAAAWNDFWARHGPGGATGCLPARWQSVYSRLESTWQTFAATLPERACVLDLATGDARVLNWMGRERTDLVRMGVDLSPDLPPPPPGIEIHAGVAMEDLPFADDSLDAIVSQFGVEYGDTPKVASEIARVADADASMAFVIHREDGAILSHNLARVAQIRWVLDEIGLIDATRAAIAQEAPPWEEATAMVTARVAEGRQRYGDHSAGWEIPEAIRRSLLMGARAGDTAQGVAELLGRIEVQARNELARIASLEEACRTTGARDSFLGAFDDVGLELTDNEELHDAAGRLFAEMLHMRQG
ncbi:class I SAM-dependent methyltransferase [Alteriqipengyuania sp. 357]